MTISEKTRREEFIERGHMRFAAESGTNTSRRCGMATWTARPGRQRAEDDVWRTPVRWEMAASGGADKEATDVRQ